MQFFSSYANAKESASVKKGSPWWLVLIFSVAIYLIFRIGSLVGGGIAVAIITAINGGDLNAVSTDSPVLMAVVLLCTAFMIGATALFARVIDKIRMKHMGLKADKFPLRYLGGLVCGFIMFSAAVLMAKILSAADISASNDLKPLYLLLLIPGWIVQGFSEEFLCRGYIMTAISKRYSTLLGVLVNSVVFALLHSFNTGISVLAMINLFLFGLFASLLVLISENIWFAAALHSVWNFVQGNFYGIPVSGNSVNPESTVFISSFDSSKGLINGGRFGIEGGICATTVLVLGTVAAYIIYRKKHPQTV